MLFLCIYICVQILLESFPISSSGHCALLEYCYFFFNQSSDGSFESYFFLTKNICKEHINALIHAPTLIILTLFFFKRWFLLIKHPVRCRFIIMKLAFYGAISTAIALVFYFVIPIQNFRLPLGIGFLITLLWALSTYWISPGTVSLTLCSSIIIGLGQAIALLPGISRLGTTYAMARWLGISSKRAIEISFMMQTPLLLGALAKSIVTISYQDCLDQILNIAILLVMIVATVGAWFGLRITYYSALHNQWWRFAIYMIIPLCLWGVLTVIS